MYISLWLQNTEFRNVKTGSFPSVEVSGGLRQLFCSHMGRSDGCLLLLASQAWFSVGSPELELLSLWKSLGILRQKDSLGTKPRQDWD